jgi:capsule polysaccharide export protein KpsE/RkpR
MKLDIVLSAIALLISAIVGGISILGSVRSSDNNDVNLADRIATLERADTEKSDAIKQLQIAMNTIQHNQIESAMDIKFLIKQFDNIIKVTVKRD